LRFKLEVFLLSAAIALFVLSSFFYSYQVDNQNIYAAAGTADLAPSPATASFPYQTYAISFIGFGSLLMVAASISYQRKTKELNLAAKELNQ
jgi:hypothetical protein